MKKICVAIIIVCVLTLAINAIAAHKPKEHQLHFEHTSMCDPLAAQRDEEVAK
jgi:hypothetical protein